MSKRYIIKFAGASGQGINSLGEMFAKLFKNNGYKIFGYREYPSLIKGGYSSYQIDIANNDIHSSYQKVDLLVAIGRSAVHQYLFDIKENGLLIHSLPKMIFGEQEKEFITKNNVKVIYIDAQNISWQLGSSYISTNIVIAGYVWKLLGQNIEDISAELTTRFAKKPKLLEIDLIAVQKGAELLNDDQIIDMGMKRHDNWEKSYLMTGNDAMAISSYACGVRAYYSYPMTPASSILSTVAKQQHQTGILVKQAEDEITAAQMAIGSMFMGTRALVATSGGGFDLMTETISLAGITETPFVCIIAQRPGPATGLPTWTSAGDLNLAIYSGHGEFPRCVLAAGDCKSAYSTLQNAFDIAEKYQITVLLLTEKQIAESIYNVDNLPEGLEVKRYLTEINIDSKDQRFQYTENGISPRWLPGQIGPMYDANSDEHTENGSIAEDATTAKKMMDKRMNKQRELFNNIPEPTLYGDQNPDVVIVGWGSTYGGNY
jgi:2-oxoglutarate/2-oxoacid ferredoxin oxidoreductase subunit alpha